MGLETCVTAVERHFALGTLLKWILNAVYHLAGRIAASCASAPRRRRRHGDLMTSRAKGGRFSAPEITNDRSHKLSVEALSQFESAPSS